MNALTNIHKKVSKQLKNPTVVNVLRALLVVNALMVKSMPTDLLNVYQHLYTRVAVAALVAYLVYVDPILAVLVTVVYVISIRESQNRRVASVVPVDSADTTVSANNGNGLHANSDLLDVNITRVLEEMNDEALPSEGENPVDQTLTENISLEDPSYRQLDVVQTNNITGTDPDEPVKSFKETNDAQGLSFVKGHNSGASQTSKF